MTPARANGIRAELIEGKRKTKGDKRKEEAARPTLARLWEAYSLTLKNKNTLDADKCNYRRLEEAFAHKSVADIVTDDIDTLRDKLLSTGLAPQTVKHSLALLRRIVRHGTKKNLCQVPFQLFFNMPKVDNVKTECLTQEQLKLLLEALDADPDQSMASLMRLALATGMRRGALLDLQWTDIDFEREFITLRGKGQDGAAKSGRTEKIPLNPAARDILEKTYRFGDSPYVFPNPSGGKRTEMRHFIKRIQKKAGLPEGFRPLHGLRHTFASFLASSGEVDLYTLQKLLTHNSPAMTQRYAHLADEAMQRASGVAAGLFSGLTSKPEQKK